MNKTNLLLSTAVGLAFVVAGPSAMAVGKKHPNGGKHHAGINFAKAPFKTHKIAGHPAKNGDLAQRHLGAAMRWHTHESDDRTKIPVLGLAIGIGLNQKNWDSSKRLSPF